MFNTLLPRTADNTYRGNKLALWLFGLVVFMRAGISLGSIFNGYNAASSADGIALDTFGPDGARAVVSLFAVWGLSQFVICLLGLLVLVRYRALVPFMFALLSLEHLTRRLILQVMPIVHTGGTAPGFIINLVLLALMLFGLALSLRSQGNSQAQK